MSSNMDKKMGKFLTWPNIIAIGVMIISLAFNYFQNKTINKYEIGVEQYSKTLVDIRNDLVGQLSPEFGVLRDNSKTQADTDQAVRNIELRIKTITGQIDGQLKAIEQLTGKGQGGH